MSFWDRFRKPNSYKNGKKHGKWTEPDDHQIIECTYVDGIRQGPFILRRQDGSKLKEGSFVDGSIDGLLTVWSADGKKLGEGTMRAGELHGHFIQWHDSGALSYESDYVVGQRQGPWKYGFDNGQLQEEGAHILGVRDGAWKIFSKEGVVLEEGSYKQGKRNGRWIFRRPDGKPRCEGEFTDDVMTGPWRVWSAEGVERPARAYRDDADIQRWEKLRASVDLLASYTPDQAWFNRVKGVFEELAKPWQVEKRTDEYGQTFISAPISVGWQLEAALGTPVLEICRQQCWSTILNIVEKLERADAPAAMELVEPLGRYPYKVAQEWLTTIFEEEEDDPRTRLVSRFEPGRSFSMQMMERFRRRVPHLQGLTLRECEFPEGLVPLFGEYPELERLHLIDCGVAEKGIANMVAHLSKATWMGKLIELIIMRCGQSVTDAPLATMLAKMPSLRWLTLDRATLGPRCAEVLPKSGLESIELRDSKIDRAGLTALASMPKLQKLTLRRCELPALTTQQARELPATGVLKWLTLEHTLDVAEYDSKFTGYGVARRLARIAAFAHLETLDLSYNEFSKRDYDRLVVRALGRSPHLRKLPKLIWAGNETDEHDLELLREALPDTTIETKAKNDGSVIHIKV